jgi:hypothetical protein
MYRNCPICGKALYGRVELKEHVVAEHGYDATIHKHFEEEPSDSLLNAAILEHGTMWPGYSEPAPSAPEPEPESLPPGGGDFGGGGVSTDFSSPESASSAPDVSDVSPITDGSGPSEG